MYSYFSNYVCSEDRQKLNKFCNALVNMDITIEDILKTVILSILLLEVYHHTQV